VFLGSFPGVIASALPRAVLVADNDYPSDLAPEGMGQKVANASGRPFFLPPEQGQDFNDFHSAVGLFKASQALRKLLYR